MPDGLRNTTNTEPDGSNRNGTVVRPSASRETGAGSIVPVSGRHSSGALPVTRNVHSTASPVGRWLALGAATAGALLVAVTLIGVGEGDPAPLAFGFGLLAWFWGEE